METFRQYDAFKEKCLAFPEKFEERFLSGEHKLICHPFVKGELISLCSDEEAHSNALHICRMSDMLIMSEDAANWSAFNLMEARGIAEQNGFVYISDLLAEDAFLSEEWMINGKNDTIIVNEEYMREKGKKYAPVTPLTNSVLHFKKYTSDFFWKSAPLGQAAFVDKEYAAERFKEYFEECSALLPDLSGAKTINFMLFGDNVAIDSKTTRAIAIESYFAQIDNIIKTFSRNTEMLELIGYDFSELEFILDLTSAALRKNGVELSKEDFTEKYYSPVINSGSLTEDLAALGQTEGTEDINAVKLAFINAVSAEYKEEDTEDDVSYSADDFSFYKNGIRKLEQNSYSEDEEKFMIEELVTHKPADHRIFYYASRKYPEETENLAAIAEFWQIAPVSGEDLENIILNDYILDESFDEQGRFCAGYEQSCILREQLIKVSEKYGLSNSGYIEELDEHIDILDKERRTFNGTLFDTPEQMQLAVKNEAYVRDLCRNLSALNESELHFLAENIQNTTLDDDTKAKYLVKVNLALDVVQTSALEQCCLSLPVMTLGEIAALKEEISEYDYPEAVVKPFMSRIKKASDAAQKNEIEAMLENPEKLTAEQLDSIIDKLSSGRYDESIADYYRIKTFEIKENNIRSEIDGLMNGYDELGKEQLEELLHKLSDGGYPGHLTYGPIKTITDAINNYEVNEAAKIFDGVEFATAEQLEAMKHAIEYGRFSDEIAAPYAAKVEQREKDLLNEELDEMCSGIDSMQQEELDKLRDEIVNSDKEYDPQLKEKYLDSITQRVVELKNSELAELCKYIFSMEQPELDELRIKLSDESYDKEFTAVYFKKIEERERELLIAEINEFCGNMDEKDIPQLEELKENILQNEKYAEFAEQYAADIDSRIAAIRIADYRKVIDSTADMTSEQIAEFRRNAEEKRSEIGEELYERSIEAADKRDDAIETERIDRIAGNIEEYDFEKADAVKKELLSGNYPEEKTAPYIEKINARVYELNKADLDSFVEGIDDMDKEQLIQAQIKIQEYGHDCPAELKQIYSDNIKKAMSEIADKEVRELCGNIEALTAKKSAELIRKLNTMPLDEAAKERYIDALDAHISALKKNESKDYIWHLSGKMDEFNVNSVHLCVPTLSNLFYDKYETACKTYISAGRYELPILLHEGNNGDSFTVTTEYLHILSKGVMNRIKIDEIASFQAKRTLMSSVLTAVKRNGETVDLPNSLNKNIVENVSKVLTSLVNFIHDKRSAEHMKELLENAVQEKAMQASIPVETPVPDAPAAEAEPKAEQENIAEEGTSQAEPAEETPSDGENADVPASADTDEETPQQDSEQDDNGVSEESAPVSEEETSESIPEEAEETVPAEETAPAEEAVPTEEAAAAEETAPKEEAAPAEEKPKIRFCDQCGAKITSPNAKFCAECGNKLM